MVVILMGVSGCGKSTVGELLAERLGGAFYDGDDFHPEANVAKMRSGQPLDDDDRRPWLESLAGHIRQWNASGQTAVLACSALKQKYRDLLGVGEPGVHLVYMRGDYDLIAERLAARDHQYMPPSLLQSQFDALEEPTDAIAVDIGPPPERVVDAIVDALPGDQA